MLKFELQEDQETSENSEESASDDEDIFQNTNRLDIFNTWLPQGCRLYTVRTVYSVDIPI